MNQAPGPARRGRRAADTVAVLIALGGLNVVRDRLPSGTMWLSAVATPALVVAARGSGLSWGDLGLARNRLPRGVSWGMSAAGMMGVTYALAVLHPETRTLVLDPRYQLTGVDALHRALVVIPIGTVLLEEIAFRAVLWGLLARDASPRATLLVSSGLFGLWHVLPALDAVAGDRRIRSLRTSRRAADVTHVLGTIAVTALGGVVMGELRRRSDSLLAPAAFHWAVNGLGVLAGVAARGEPCRPRIRLGLSRRSPAVA